MKKTFLLVIVIAIIFNLINGYPWPMKNSSENFSGPLSISATLGDLRGNVALYRFHRGIDIADSGEVYAIWGGLVKHDGSSGDNAYVRINNIWYVHLTNRIKEDSIVLGIDGNLLSEIVPIGETNGGHLHFQIGEFNTDGPFYNPLFYADSLDNYSDDNLPIFDSIIYYKAFTTINGLEASIETTDVRVKPDSVLFNNSYHPVLSEPIQLGIDANDINNLARVVTFVRFSKI